MTTMSKDVSVASQPCGMPLGQAEEILGRERVYVPSVHPKLAKHFARDGLGVSVPFSVRRLALARGRQALVYNPPGVTLASLLGMTQGLFTGGMPIFMSTESCESNLFFEQEELRPGWMLIDTRVTEDWFGEDYLSQTKIVGRHMKVFTDGHAYGDVSAAVAKFDGQAERLGRRARALENTVPSEQMEFANELMRLELNRFRPTAVEVVWAVVLREAAEHEVMLKDHFAWTQSLGTEGIIRVGCFSGQGGIVNFIPPLYSNESTGALLSEHAR